MSKLPLTTMYVVSQRCPQCGSEEYKRVKAKTALAFTDDRVCLPCGTRYTPPTPAWGRALFALFGLGFLAAGIALAIAMFPEELPPYKGPVLSLLAGVLLGGGFLYKAFTGR